MVQSLYSHGSTSRSLSPSLWTHPILCPTVLSTQPAQGAPLERWPSVVTQRGSTAVSDELHDSPIFKKSSVPWECMCRGSTNCDASALYVGQWRIMRGGSLSHMAPNAHAHQAAEQFKSMCTCLWWRCFRCVCPPSQPPMDFFCLLCHYYTHICLCRYRFSPFPMRGRRN